MDLPANEKCQGQEAPLTHYCNDKWYSPIKGVCKPQVQGLSQLFQIGLLQGNTLIPWLKRYIRSLLPKKSVPIS